MTATDVIAEIDGEEIVIRIRMPKRDTPDSLIRLDKDSCNEAGFELRGLRAKIEKGELESVKIGRASYVRKSDLLALVAKRAKARPVAAVASSAPVPAPAASSAYATALASNGRRRAG